MSKRFTAAQVAQLVFEDGRAAASTTQIDHLVRIGAVTPARRASRRGVSNEYDALNLVEIMASVELIDANIPGELVARTVARIREPEHWSKLANPATRDEAAILGLARLAGRKSKSPLAMFFRPEDIGQTCNAGYTILAAVPIGYIMRFVEKFTGEPFA